MADRTKAMQLSEDDVTAELRKIGRDDTDPLERALFREAYAAAGPVDPKRKAAPLAQRYAAATHLSDSVIGGLVGVSRATMQAYRSGRLPEKFEPVELAELRRVAEEQLTALNDVINDLARIMADGLH